MLINEPEGSQDKDYISFGDAKLLVKGEHHGIQELSGLAGIQKEVYIYVVILIKLTHTVHNKTLHRTCFCVMHSPRMHH